MVRLWFARLLVVGMVPVVILATPRLAEASYQVGDVATASISAGGAGPSPGLSCGVSGYFVNDNGSPTVRMSGSCSTGWQVSHVDMTLTVDAGSCAFSIHYPQLDGSGSLVGSMTPTVAGPLNVATCIGTELCYAANVRFHGDMADTLGDDYIHTGCVPFGLGQMPDADPAPNDGQCTKVKVTQPTFTTPVKINTSGPLYEWRTTMKATITGNPGQYMHPYVIGEGGLNSPFVTMPAAVDGGVYHRAILTPAVVIPGPTGPGTVQVSWTVRISGGSNPSAPTLTVIGAGFFDSTGVAGDWENGFIKYPQHEPRGRIGLSNPSVCAFYWGRKVADLPANDFDEPISALTAPPVELPDETDPDVTPPEPATPGCQGFSLWDPTSWASAGICALVEAVLWLGDKLGRAIAAVAGAILNGLSALFVPDDFPDFSDIGSPLPDGWVPDMPSLGGSGCGSLTFPEVKLGYQGWTAGPVDFANTCAAPWPTVRALTYNGGLVLLLVSAVWMGFRAITSGLGLGVAMGSGGRDDE